MENRTFTGTITVNDENFDDEVLQSNIPVLVDFWAAWCESCKAIGSSIDALAADYQGKVKVAKLNVEDNPQAPWRFGVRSIPTLIVFKDGAAQQTAIGVRLKEQLAVLIDQYVY